MKVLVVRTGESRLGFLKQLSEFEFAERDFISSEETCNAALSLKPDAILIDFRIVAEVKAVDLISQLRVHLRSKSYPIMVVGTAQMEDEIDFAFLAGADEYFSQPVSCTEFRARISKLKIRLPVEKEKPAREFAHYGQTLIEVDSKLRAVRINGLNIGFTTGEFLLFAALFDADGHIHFPSFLTRLLSPSAPTSPNVLRVHFCNMRAKLGPIGAAIIAVRKFGYRFVTEAEWAEMSTVDPGKSA